MSFDASWDINHYKTEHESEEQWSLRKTFMEKWKNDYPEDRLVCLAQIFANIEFLGCRYPLEVMKEISGLALGIADNYRTKKAKQLQRTFVSASDAATDRAKGVKREGGVVIEPPKKSLKIEFVAQGENENTENVISKIDSNTSENTQDESIKNTKNIFDNYNQYNYIDELERIPCLDVRKFSENMFNTKYGKMILLVRPWTNKLNNITASCHASRLSCTINNKDKLKLIYINNIQIGKVWASKVETENFAWNLLIREVPIIYYKEQWTKDSKCISVGDVKKEQVFGTPVENAVALKMMKIMGWKGGGLGADSQGIEEPIKPHLQMVKRAGLGAFAHDLRQLRNSGKELMRKFQESDSIDIDLVFSSEFTKEERALLHQVAVSCGLTSKSYGTGDDRFLVVRKKTNVFTLFRTIVDKGGETSKFKVYLPKLVAGYK